MFGDFEVQRAPCYGLSTIRGRVAKPEFFVAERRSGSTLGFILALFGEFEGGTLDGDLGLAFAAVSAGFDFSVTTVFTAEGALTSAAAGDSFLVSSFKTG